MKINMDDYLRKNRDQLDVEQPEEDRIWEGIRSELYQRRHLRTSRLLRIAAVLLLLIGLGFIVHLKINQRQLQKANLYAISELLGSKEQDYIDTVNVRLEKIKNIPAGDDEIIADLLNELTVLDTIYNEAYSNLSTVGYKEEIVNILFDTYEKRIRILEQIIFESQKPKENENNENMYNL